MPELAEVALMAVEVNRHRHHIFNAVARSAIAKLGPDLPLPRCWRTFRLEARSRGKEMRLDIWPVKIDARLRLQEAKERQQLNEAKSAEAEADEQQEEQDEDEDEDEEKEQSTPQRKRKRKTAVNGRGKPFTRVHAENPIIPLDGPLPLLFRCGMTGHIQAFPSHTATHKHAHLSFLSSEPSEVAVCFVDQRQFGRWLVTSEWDRTRGPCPLTEYASFRRHVLDSLSMRAMEKPLCEVMLDQRFMNGIGNYLRAEICHRADVNPFASARTVLTPLVGAVDRADRPDVLRLCHDVPMEVYTFGYRYGSMNNEQEVKRQKEEWEAKEQAAEAEVEGDAKEGVEDARGRAARESLPPTKLSRKSFAQWLRCYEKHNLGMLSTVDGKGRAMWHSSKWRVSGKSKAGSRRPKKGKTISGADREEDEDEKKEEEEDESAAAEAESEETTRSSRKKKQKGQKKQKKQSTKKSRRKVQEDADDADEAVAAAAAAVSNKQVSGRKRTRVAAETDSAASGARKSSRRQHSGVAAASASAAVKDDDELPEQYRGGVERRRSNRLSAQKGQQGEDAAEPVVSQQQEEEAAPEKENAAAVEGEEEQTAGSKKRAKKAAVPRRTARELRQHNA